MLRRLAAMSRKARVQALQPVPWFPILRPRPGWCREGQREVDGVCIRSLGMFYIPKYFKSLDAYWLYRSIIGELSALRRRGSLHVIDAHFAYPDGVGCVMAARQLGLPVVVTVRGVEEEYLEEASIGVKIRDALANADGCICVSHSLRERMIEAGVPESRTRVIHNGVDRGVFAPGNRESARAELGIGQGERLIVSVGNLLSVKCHDVLLRAFAALQQKMSKTRLVIIGGASYEPGEPDRLKRLCSELGIASRVRFAGRLPTAAVAAWLRAADAFALASRREGCCNALLEALSTGVPAVVTAVGDNPWFVGTDENGLLVPVGDSLAMCSALENVLRRGDWDQHRISAGLKAGNWDAVADEVLGFMGAIVQQRADASSTGTARHAGLKT